MWMNNIIVGFADDLLVRAAEKGGIWMWASQAVIGFIDRHMFRAITNEEDTEQDVDSDLGVEESLAGGM